MAAGQEPPKETELQAAEETEDADSSEESGGESGENPLDLLPAFSNIRLRSDSEEATRDARIEKSKKEGLPPLDRKMQEVVRKWKSRRNHYL